MSLSSKHLVLKGLLAAALASTLSACVAPVMVGGAMVTGLVAADRRTSGAQLEDQTIEVRGTNRIRDTLGTRVRVSITSYNRQVLLTGEAPNERDKQRVGEVIASLDNVRNVVNEVAIIDTPSFSERSSDAMVTTKVLTAFLDAKDLSANAFKVVTEHGAVYLMGRVTQREADRAAEIARTTSGVKRVVRVFEIISEEELRRLQQQPAS